MTACLSLACGCWGTNLTLPPMKTNRHRAQPACTANQVRSKDKSTPSAKPSSNARPSNARPSSARPSVSSREQQANIRQKEKSRMQVDESLFGDLEGRHVSDSSPGGNGNDDYDSFKRYLDRKKQARRDEMDKRKWLYTSTKSLACDVSIEPRFLLLALNMLQRLSVKLRCRVTTFVQSLDVHSLQDRGVTFLNLSSCRFCKICKTIHEIV